MTLEPIQRPLPARALDLADRALRATGLRRSRLNPEAIKADAVATTGLDDFGADDFEEGLAVFCRSAESEANIDLVGRAVLKTFLRRILCNRQLLVDYRKITRNQLSWQRPRLSCSACHVPAPPFYIAY